MAHEVATDGIAVFAFAPAAHTDMSRQLYEDEEIPLTLRDEFRTVLLEEGDDLLRYTLEMFRFIATGGADHLSGQHLGLHATGRHSIDELRNAVPS